MKEITKIGKILRAAGSIFLAAGFGTPALATPNESGWYHILELTGGWSEPNLSIRTDGTFYNPENCAWPGLYIVPENSLSRELFQSMAISAFMGGKEVSFVVDGCVNNFPKVIAVKIR